MGLGDVLDTAFKLLRVTFVPAALIVLVVFGPLQLLAALAFPTPNFFEFDATTGVADPDIGRLVVGGLAGIVTWLLTPLVNGALVWLGAEYESGRDPDWTDAYRAVVGHFGALLVAGLLIGLAGIVAAVALVAPAVAIGAAGVVPLAVLWGIVAVLLLFAIFLAGSALFYVVAPAIVLEDLGAVEGLRRSFNLIRPRIWPILGIVVVAGLILLLVNGIIAGISGVLGLLLPAGWIVVAIGGILAQVLVAPLTAYVALAVYVDQRIRHEGYDLALRAAAPSPAS